MVDDMNRGEGQREHGGEARRRGGGHDYRNRIFEHTQEAREEAQLLATSLGELTRDVSSYVEQQVQTRPWAVLGVAAAVGYVIGGGLPSRITRAGLSIGTRLATGMLVRQFVEGQAGAFAGGGREDVDTGV